MVFSDEEDFQLMSLYIDSNKTFDIQSELGVPGNSKNMTLTSTYDGEYAFYNRGTFNAQLGTVTIGGTATQSIGGSSVTTFYNLTINNAAGVTLENNANISTTLSRVISAVLSVMALSKTFSLVSLRLVSVYASIRLKSGSIRIIDGSMIFFCLSVCSVFFVGSKKSLFRLFCSFFQSRSHRYAPEKTSQTIKKTIFLYSDKNSRTRSKKKCNSHQTIACYLLHFDILC